MNILDIKETDSKWDDYYVWETVQNRETRIVIVLDNENDDETLDLENFNVGKLIRPLRKKLDFVEQNRALIDDVILRGEIEDFTADDLKTLYIDEMFFQYYVDTGNCELVLYMTSETDCLDGGTVIVGIDVDNEVTFDDIM